MPKGGDDYPTNWNQFSEWFHTEESCLAYLERLRWPQGYVCPRCKNQSDPYRSSRGRLICPACRFQSTTTAGTIFDKTRTPLRVWFAGAWYVTNQKHGANALGLQRVLGLGSYQTAWTMLHRFRQAMVRPGRERLHGLVEVDETYLSITDRYAPPATKKKKALLTKRWLLSPSKCWSQEGLVVFAYNALPMTRQSVLCLSFKIVSSLVLLYAPMVLQLTGQSRSWAMNINARSC